MAIQSPYPLVIPDLHRHIAWRLAATVAVLLVVGSAVGAGIGFVLVRSIELVLSGIV